MDFALNFIEQSWFTLILWLTPRGASPLPCCGGREALTCMIEHLAGLTWGRATEYRHQMKWTKHLFCIWIAFCFGCCLLALELEKLSFQEDNIFYFLYLSCTFFVRGLGDEASKAKTYSVLTLTLILLSSFSVWQWQWPGREGKTPPPPPHCGHST